MLLKLNLRLLSLSILFLISGMVFSNREAVSCPIPVFRYALEFWEPDPYRVTVYTQGSLTDAEKQVQDALTGNSAGRSAVSNIDVTLVDLEEEPQALSRQRRGEEPVAEFPWMVVQYPFVTGKNELVWEGPLTMENANRLLHSPVREELARKLVQGEVVWLFLESGNRSRDNELFNLLENELQRLEQTLELPDPEQWWTGRDEMDEPEIKFETIRISRDDPAEEHLVNMLLNSEEDLEDFGSEAMVFPFYGRGIALWAIVGNGINAWNIMDAAEFLIGPCSCQVKMLNPGIDMIVSKDWEGSVDMISDEMLTPVTGFSEFEERGEEARRRLEEGTEEQEVIDDTETEDERGVDIPEEEDREEAPYAETDPETTTPSEREATTSPETEATTPSGREATTPSDFEAREKEGGHFTLIAAIFGIMAVVVLAGIILFIFTGNERRRKQ